jgi:hypothetical protein
MNKTEFMEKISLVEPLIQKQKEMIEKREIHKREVKERVRTLCPYETDFGTSVTSFKPKRINDIVGMIVTVVWFFIMLVIIAAVADLTKYYDGPTGRGSLVSDHIFIALLLWAIVPIFVGRIATLLLTKKNSKAAKKYFEQEDVKIDFETEQIVLAAKEISRKLDGALSEKYCYFWIIKKVKEFFEDNRAESLADAVNLFVIENGKPDNFCPELGTNGEICLDYYYVKGACKWNGMLTDVISLADQEYDR